MTRPHALHGLNALHAAQRGLSLIDALVALAVAAATALAAAAAQATLRQQAEATRQRSEAVRLAQARLEAARPFARLEARADGPGWDGLASQAAQAVDAIATPTAYRVEQQVSAEVGSAAKAVAVAVRWTGRDGREHSLGGQTLVAAAAPQLSGSLALPRATLALGRPAGRHVGVPLGAQDLGNGRSAWVPVAGHPQAWVFSHLTGAVTGVCRVATAAPVLTAEALAGCADNTAAQWIGGHVRFGGDAAAPTDAALHLDVHLDAPGAQCVDDAPATANPAQRVVRWACLVPAGAGGWSGRVSVRLLPFQGDNAAPARAVCRYAATAAQHTAITTPLMHQNYLVAPDAAPCPPGAEAA